VTKFTRPAILLRLPNSDWITEVPPLAPYHQSSRLALLFYSVRLDAQAPSSQFFKKVNKGRAYRCQALELIKICRIFSAGPEQPFHGEHFLRDAKLQEYLPHVTPIYIPFLIAILRVLKECDLTIARAIDSRCKLREDTGLPFERATRKLLEYASKFHLR
jgi:hypothetical protein